MQQDPERKRPAKIPAKNEEDFSDLRSCAIDSNVCVIRRPDSIPSSILDIYDQISARTELAQLLGVPIADVRDRLIESTQVVTTRDGVNVYFPREVILERSRELTELSEVTKSELPGYALTRDDPATNSLVIYDFELPSIREVLVLNSKAAVQAWRQFQGEIDRGFAELCFRYVEVMSEVGQRIEEADRHELERIYNQAKDLPDMRSQLLRMTDGKLDIDVLSNPQVGLYHFVNLLKGKSEWVEQNVKTRRFVGDEKFSELPAKKQDSVIRELVETKWRIVSSPDSTNYGESRDSAGITAHTHPLELDLAVGKATIFSRDGLREYVNTHDITELLSRKIDSLNIEIERCSNKLIELARGPFSPSNSITSDFDIRGVELDKRHLERECYRANALLERCMSNGAFQGLARIYESRTEYSSVTEESRADAESGGSGRTITPKSSTRIDFIFNLGGASLVIEDLSTGIADNLSIAVEDDITRKTRTNLRIGATLDEHSRIDAAIDLLYDSFLFETGTIVNHYSAPQVLVLRSEESGRISFAYPVDYFRTRYLISFVTENNGAIAERLGIKFGYRRVDAELYAVFTFHDPDSLRSISTQELNKLIVNNRLKHLNSGSLFKLPFLHKVRDGIGANRPLSLAEIESASQLVAMAYYDTDNRLRFASCYNHVRRSIEDLKGEDRFSLEKQVQIIRRAYTRDSR